MEVLVVWLLCGVSAAIIAKTNGRDVLNWFLLGMVLGPFGVLFASIASSRDKDSASLDPY